jgi:hypothetical protein
VSVLAVLAGRLRRELEPTAILIDRFGREHLVALGRIDDETARTRRRIQGD